MTHVQYDTYLVVKIFNVLSLIVNMHRLSILSIETLRQVVHLSFENSLIHPYLFPVNYLNFTWKCYLFISDHLISSMEKTPTYTKTTPEINGEPAVKKHCRLLNGGLSPHKNGLTPVRQRLEQQRKKLMETDNAGQQETSPTLQKLRDTPGNRRPRGHTSC